MTELPDLSSPLLAVMAPRERSWDCALWLGIQVGPERGRQTQWPAVDLNTNSNSFVAPALTEIFCVDLPSFSCHASIV